MAAVHSNGQAVVFYSSDLILLFIFFALYLRGRRTPPRWTFATMLEYGVILSRRSKGAVCIPYILSGENLQIVPHNWAMVRV